MTTTMLEILGLEDDPFTAWRTAGAKANSGATGIASTQSMEKQSDGSTLFETKANQPYGDGFWYNRLLLSHPQFAAQLKAANRFTLGIKLLVKAVDFPWTRCVEWEVQQTIGGEVFNFSLQAKPGGNLRSYDKVSQRWTEFPTPIPCTLKPDVWQHIYFDGAKETGGLRISQVNVDGVKTIQDGGLFHPKLVAPHADSINPAIQTDSQRGTYSGGVWTPPPPSRVYAKDFNLKFA